MPQKFISKNIDTGIAVRLLENGERRSSGVIYLDGPHCKMLQKVLSLAQGDIGL